MYSYGRELPAECLDRSPPALMTFMHRTCISLSPCVWMRMSLSLRLHYLYRQPFPRSVPVNCLKKWKCRFLILSYSYLVWGELQRGIERQRARLKSLPLAPAINCHKKNKIRPLFCPSIFYYYPRRKRCWSGSLKKLSIHLWNALFQARTTFHTMTRHGLELPHSFST